MRLSLLLWHHNVIIPGGRGGNVVSSLSEHENSPRLRGRGGRLRSLFECTVSLMRRLGSSVNVRILL